MLVSSESSKSDQRRHYQAAMRSCVKSFQKFNVLSTVCYSCSVATHVIIRKSRAQSVEGGQSHKADTAFARRSSACATSNPVKLDFREHESVRYFVPLEPVKLDFGEHESVRYFVPLEPSVDGFSKPSMP